MNARNFFSELKRRNVYKVAVAYGVIAWLLIQAGSILFPTFEAPGWVMKVAIAGVALGFRWRRWPSEKLTVVVKPYTRSGAPI